MLLAVAGTVCLVMVVVTSVRAARGRLRYESWHLLHLYAYLGVGLALPHQLWTGQEFLASPARPPSSGGPLWAAAAGSVLGLAGRAAAVAQSRHRLRVTSVVPRATVSCRCTSSGRDLDRLPYGPVSSSPGASSTGPGWTRAHPYSLSAAPDGRSLRITVKDLGDGSRALRPAAAGHPRAGRGPVRPAHRAGAHGRRIALIGAGVGITPLRALAEELDYAPGDAVLLHRFTGRPLFDGEFAVLARERGLEVVAAAGAPAGRRLLARGRRRRGRRPHRPTGCPTSPSATSTSADRSRGPPTSASASGGRPPTEHVHVETFGW